MPFASLTPQRFSWPTVLAVLLLAGCPGPGQAQDEGDDEPYLPGLVASYRDGKGNTAARVDPQLAFEWGKAPPDPRLLEGEFQAAWRGRLLVQARGEYRFFFYGTGEVGLKVGGREVVARQALRNSWYESSPATLGAEAVSVELSFRRTEGDARLMVLWSGPDFGLEPIPPRLLSHAREQTAKGDFERGQLLARVLRCARCHGDDQAPPPAPALDRLAGNVARGWLVRWLAAAENATPEPGELLSPRRMPALGLTDAQAEAVADWLLSPREKDGGVPASPAENKPAKGEKKPKLDAQMGERLFLTLGCLACHTWRDLGASGWLGGGDLTHIADKRPPAFFAAWLADPARFNRDHRMPVFSLSEDEQTALGMFLADQKTKDVKPDFTARSTAERRSEGGKLIEQFRCGACHQLPGTARANAAPSLPRLAERSGWDRSCAGSPDADKCRPGYRLSDADAQALRVFFSIRLSEPESRPARPDGRMLLAESNCLACHAREGTRTAIPMLPPLLADKLTAVAKRYPDLAPLVPALTPPPLTSVGDKLTDSALTDAIARRGEPHRPYFQVRMPRFAFRDEELQALVQHLAVADRVPDRGTGPARPLDQAQQDRYALAGGRLVSSDGFGCTSCHQVGTVLPSQAQLNARGPDLSQLGRTIRREWFDRWVRNPARIVPRMEMPSVQIPVAGVLDDKLDDQLAAVWHVLNQPGFEPPPPNPIRTLRHDGNHANAEPVVVTDVLQQAGKSWVKPFLVGMANRHNVLIDLETAALARWTVGDTARQQTKGKAWFWESGGATVLDPGMTGPDLVLLASGQELPPKPLEQFVTEADAWQVEGPAVELHYRLAFKEAMLHVRRRFAPVTAGAASGFGQEVSVGPLPSGTRGLLRLLPAGAGKVSRSVDGREIRLGDRFSSRIILREPVGAKFSEDGTSLFLTPDEKGTARAVLHYLSEVPVDRLPVLPAQPAAARKGEPAEIAPGFAGERLPLPAEIMPTGLAWRPDGKLVFCSLKGQVYEATDTDGDGSEDRLQVLADGLPSPYGINTGPDFVDVSAKYAVLRVSDGGASGRRVEAVASGWGYTQDYHDWAIGLPRNDKGEYFLGIPCQQDKRSQTGARFHGNVLRLVPRKPSEDDPRRFVLEPISAGHRFPTGLALDRDGELFVTDNQGNYNPFNELNHVRPGAHFGFINALDKGKPAPPLTPPAIDIPHPWTRSVNGICFLYTPKAMRDRSGRDVFGPLEGHLVGCEYDTRRLVRLTLQKVGDTYQGAAYPLSIPPADAARGMLGPLVCAVSPRGELYVGSIRDSGWGAGNNIGEIIRVRVEPDKLPCGIAEVRATADGFTVDFFRPVDLTLAGQIESYSVQSYRRESTPAYGGPDLDRRTEKVTKVAVTADGRRVALRLAELRPGFVYEFRLKRLAPGGADFHPDEAHYTLRAVPR